MCKNQILRSSLRNPWPTSQNRSLGPRKAFGLPFAQDDTSIRLLCDDEASAQCDGGTYSWGSAEPSPKKNCSICSTRNCCACGVQGCRRYSLSSIFWRSTHSLHAAFDTFLYIFWPNSESKGGSSSPSSSFL